MRPNVTVYSEVSADGKSAFRRGSSSKDIMVFEGDDIRKFRHELRAKSDAIMVGGNTVRLDDPYLTVRHAPGPNPLRVIPASTGNIPLNANVISDGGRTLIAVGATATDEVVGKLQQAGASVMRTRTDQVDLAALLAHLYAMNLRSLMVEGGATLLSSLFHARLVDRLIVQHLPVLFGGSDTPCMVGGPSISRIDEAIPMQLTEVRKIGQHAVMIYDSR